MTVALVVLVALLAFANGANDNCKGVATLVGYGAARGRTALIWATITTAAGAGVSFFLAGGMIKAFSVGLFAKDTPLAGNTAFFVAVVFGAFGWVLLATRTGMPVSTTHAIVGALTGAGILSFGATNVQWSFLGAKFAVPLAISPLASLAIVYLLAMPVIWIVKRTAGRCVCVPAEGELAVAGGAVVQTRRGPGFIVGRDADCAAEGATVVATTPTAANAVHWASSGMVGFARGWNDAPKIAALMLVALPNSMGLAFAVVTIAMATGGLLMGRRVLDTLSRKVTTLPLAQSLTASLVTSSLVGMASWVSLPVSTTHVATGGIVGAGLSTDPRGVRWKTVGEIVLSWVVTLPVAALLAAGATLVVRWTGLAR